MQMGRHHTVWCRVTVLVVISALAMCGPSAPARNEEGIAVLQEEMERLGFDKEFSKLTPGELATLKASVKERMGIKLNAGTDADIPPVEDTGKRGPPSPVTNGPSPPSMSTDGKKRPEVPVKERVNASVKQTPGAPGDKPPRPNPIKKDTLGKAPGFKAPDTPKKDGKPPVGARPSPSENQAKPPATKKPPNAKKAKIEL